MNITNYLITYFFIFFVGFYPMKAQNKSFKKDSIAVNQVINNLFDGMREGDSAKVNNTFHKNVVMLTTYKNKDNINLLEKGNLDKFLNAIASPHPNIYDEKIWNTTIQIDENLAQVWTEYAFYVGTEFSHCGVNAFQLIKDKNNKWKIISLIDTRRKDKCKK